MSIPTRVTIIRPDNVIIVDGRAINGLDMSALDPQIEALQWHNGHGHIELAEDAGGRRCNIEITSLEPFAELLAQWQAAAEAEDNPPPAPWPAQLAEAKARIDWTAGHVRAAWASPGDGIEREYALAAEQAQAYLAALQGAAEPEAVPVPACVYTEMAVRKHAAEDAAALILEKAAASRLALENIRSVRLTGKASLAAVTVADPAKPTAAESAALREATELVVASLMSLRP